MAGSGQQISRANSFFAATKHTKWDDSTIWRDANSVKKDMQRLHAEVTSSRTVMTKKHRASDKNVSIWSGYLFSSKVSRDRSWSNREGCRPEGGISSLSYEFESVYSIALGF